jgi:catalase
MDGYACHTFKWVNAQKQHIYIRYKFQCVTGIKNFTRSESVLMCGEDPEYAKRDLKEFIDQGNECEWKCYVQFMTEDDVKNAKFDPFDATKMWFDSHILHSKIETVNFN